jgi:hypothetical protein
VSPVVGDMWPELATSITSSVSPAFDVFLDEVTIAMNTKPSIKGATKTFDLNRMQVDVDFVERCMSENGGDLKLAMRDLILDRQALGADARLRTEGLEIMQECPHYSQLCELASVGAQPILRPDFVANRGVGEPLRAQYFKLQPAIHHKLAEWVEKDRAILLPIELLRDKLDCFHASSIWVVLKESDNKGRMTVDFTASLLNAGTDMEAVTDENGELHLPVMREVAQLAETARQNGETVLSKYDVEAAFHRFMLFWMACLLCAIEIEGYYVIPLVGMFGWGPCPSHYNTISKTVEWAHRGGLSTETLDAMRVELDLPPIERRPEWCTPERLSRRSSTYVDDSALFSSAETFLMDAADLITIVCWLLGRNAIKEEKSEGPAECLDVIGWTVDMGKGTLAPSHKGICKLFYYLYVVTSSASRSIPTKMLDSMIGVLQHYSAVLPLVYASMGQLRNQLIRAKMSTPPKHRINLSAHSLQELAFWRGMMETALFNRALWECPLTFVQSRKVTDFQITMFSDASYTIGGGYVIPGVAYSHWKWSREECRVFEESEQHINVLELMVVVVAIWSNVKLFMNKSVRVYVDNTAALSWINALKSNTPMAKPWIRLLVLLCLVFNIHITATHIPGIDNVVADGLSRAVQDTIHRLCQSGLKLAPPMPLDCRRKLFAKQYGPEELSRQWGRIHEVLMAQGVAPSTSSVLNTISALSSNNAR